MKGTQDEIAVSVEMGNPHSSVFGVIRMGDEGIDRTADGVIGHVSAENR